jgi:hypothetical protein
MSPNGARVPFFDELPKLLFPQNTNATAGCAGDTLRAVCGSSCSGQPCSAWNLCCEATADETTRDLVAKLLTLWETYFKDGRYRDAAQIAQKALGLVPGNLAAEIALELARKHFSQNPMLGEGFFKNFHVQVNAAPTGSLRFGIGISSDAGLVGSVILNHNLTRESAPCCMDRCMIGRINCAVPTAGSPCPSSIVMDQPECPCSGPVAVSLPIVRTAVPAASPQIEAMKPDICVTATGKRVHIVSPCLEARCDRMTSVGSSGRVMLEGGVSLRFRMGDHPAKIVAEHVIVGLTDGYFEVEPAASLIPTAVFSEPATRGVQRAWWAVPVMMPAKPKVMTVPVCPAACPAVPWCPCPIDAPKP